jgi:hypothetical protein
MTNFNLKLEKKPVIYVYIGNTIKEAKTQRDLEISNLITD